MAGIAPVEIVVVGGGASGALVAARILDATFARPARVRIVEPSSRVAAGVAYGTDDPEHLLNVRASGMSADPSLPGDFVAWVEREELGGGDTFVARRDYRRYLGEHLESAARHATAGSLEVLRDRVVGVDCGSARPDVVLASGSRVSADHVVLAFGNSPPGVPASLSRLSGAPGWVQDPWSEGALDRATEAHEVLFVGTGLTMIDIALTLGRVGTGRFTAISRNGLIPRHHLEVQPPQHLSVIELERDSAGVLELTERIRTRIREHPAEDWRDVVDAIRPYVNALWQRYGDTERRVFLDQVARHWDVHRHRMSPPTSARFEALRDDDRLGVHPGEVLSAEPRAAGIEIEMMIDGRVERRTFDAVINCTGPGRSWTPPTDNPVVLDLFERGLAAPDPLGLGLSTTFDGTVLGPTGRESRALTVIGPPRRGTLFETTAIPELRSQALHLADHVVIS